MHGKDTIKPSILVSYFFLRDKNSILDPVLKVTDDILLDSGAYSAFSTGRPIPFEEYCDFVAEYGNLFTNYIALDVVGDPFKTRLNYERMLEKGLRPMPVLQYGAPRDDVEFYVKTSNKIAIAGLSRKRSSRRRAYIKWVYKNYPLPSYVHWLGMFDIPAILKLKPSSADISSWVSVRRFGNLNFPHIKIQDGVAKPRSQQSLLAHYQIDIVKCYNVWKNRQNNKEEWLKIIDMDILKWAILAYRLHQQGTKIYFVVTFDPYVVESLGRAFELISRTLNETENG